MSDERSVAASPQDIIANDRRHGYCLRQWIEARDLTGEESASSVSACAKTGPSRDTVSERRRRVLAVLGEDGGLRAPDITKRLKVSVPTAKRDLAALKRQGAVEFVGSARAGHYRLTGRRKP